MRPSDIFELSQKRGFKFLNTIITLVSSCMTEIVIKNGIIIISEIIPNGIYLLFITFSVLLSYRLYIRGVKYIDLHCGFSPASSYQYLASPLTLTRIPVQIREFCVPYQGKMC